MTREEAHELLNAAKAGVRVSTAAITHALWATGDLEPWAGSRAVEHPPANDYERTPRVHTIRAQALQAMEEA